MKSTLTKNRAKNRAGSTLVIVIALLGLLTFTGVLFFSFASQEKAAAEFFAEAAKAESVDTDDFMEFGLRQLIVGASDREQNSILFSPTDRFAILNDAFGNDISPYNGGRGVEIAHNGARIPFQRFPVLPGGADVTLNFLNLVDSPLAWGLQTDQQASNTELSNLFQNRGLQFGSVPQPDAGYTSADINSMFVAYRGFAIRDNSEDLDGDGTLDLGEDRDGDGVLNFDGNNDGILDITMTPRFEQIPVTIPSFFRPSLMKTAGGAVAPSGAYIPMDRDWVTDDPTDTTFAKRSFRPHPSHLVRNFSTQEVVPRYARDITESSALGIQSGPFQFIPTDAGATQTGNDTSVFGECGVWTGSYPTNYELDVDNDMFVEVDGSTTREGIWLDLHFPLQEHVDNTGTTRYYVALHSFTIYDLNSLMNVNVHGNANNVARDGGMAAEISADNWQTAMLSSSNLGTGPHEINPTYALRRPVDGTLSADDADEFQQHYGKAVGSISQIEQANMEWFWLLTGRADYNASGEIDNIFPGRWGEAQRLYRALTDGGNLADYPRPGRSGDYQVAIASGNGIRYGGDIATAGAAGFDDNADRFDGLMLKSRNQRRPFGLPMDIAGTGRTVTRNITGFLPNGRATAVGDSLARLSNATESPRAWPGYSGYNVVRELLTAADASSPFNYAEQYLFGRNQQLDAFATDDLLINPRFDMLMDDPLETVFDADRALRPIDNVFGPQDLAALHMTAGDIATSQQTPSSRLADLAIWALSSASPNRQLFTTLSNSYRYIPFARHGGWRAWEWTGDSDGADNDGDSFPDGDGQPEFPPQFGAIVPFSTADPFRPQLRRLIRVESGDATELLGQLPMSWNHLIDVDRQWNDATERSSAPNEGTPQFLYYMQRSGLRFRELIPHPHIDETDVASETASLTLDLNAADPDDENGDGDDVFATANAIKFPPELPSEREFWARRDRQQMARDIYVLLYTLGGGRLSAGTPRDCTGMNDPGLPEDSAGGIYTHEQLRRMAQFAVNVVDAMDRDNVVTKFEYDKNLGDGWNLDDDPLTDDGFPRATYSGNGGDLSLALYNSVTNNGLNPEDSGALSGTVVTGFERGVVYGVEGSQLALSEVFAAETPGLGSDHPATMHADELGAVQFLQVEIQNVSPLTVDIGKESTTPDKSVWRLARFDRDVTANEPLAAPSDFTRAIALLQDALGGSVAPGGSFTLATANENLAGPGGTDLEASDLFVDFDSSNGYSAAEAWERIAPDFDGSITTTTGLVQSCDIDLQATDDISTNRVARVLDDDNSVLNGGAELATKGAFLQSLQNYSGNQHFDSLDANAANSSVFANPFGSQSGGGNGFDLVLQRRLNPNMPSLSEEDNPWIEVDRVPVTFDLLNINDSTSTTMEVTTALASLQSRERSQPLGAVFANNNEADVTNHRSNTIGNENSNAVEWDQWHYHPNREFAAFSEVLQLPVVGNELLNRRIAWMNRNPLMQTITGAGTDYVDGTTATNPDWISNAASMFLQPDFPDGDETDVLINRSRDNRWHRVLPFIEIPSRVHRMLGDYLSRTVLPGKMNLNMIRHPEVYAGLIDDPALMDLFSMADTSPYYGGGGADPGNSFPDGSATTVAGGGIGSRDRWREFIEKRDGLIETYDPGDGPQTPGAVNVRLPCLPYSSTGDTSARSFKSLSNDFFHATQPVAMQETILGELAAEINSDTTNRNFLEVGSSAQHNSAGTGAVTGADATQLERHAILSKILNNTTTTSETFIVFATVGLFEAAEDPSTGLVRVGGEFDLNQDGTTTDDRKRAIFVIDRSAALQAFDAGSGSFDWESLIKARIDIQ